MVQVLQWSIMNDEKYWPNPEQFNPNRHLKPDGQFEEPRRAYIPFGIGKRNCLGEKLAMADLFLVTVRLLQATAGMNLSILMELIR